MPYPSQVVRECVAALEDAEADKSVGVVIIAGAGEEAFTIGDDLTDKEAEVLYDLIPGERFPILRKKHYFHLIEVIRSLMKPVIASVHGSCLGIGS